MLHPSLPGLEPFYRKNRRLKSGLWVASGHDVYHQKQTTRVSRASTDGTCCCSMTCPCSIGDVSCVLPSALCTTVTTNTLRVYTNPFSVYYPVTIPAVWNLDPTGNVVFGEGCFWASGDILIASLPFEGFCGPTINYILNLWFTCGYDGPGIYSQVFTGFPSHDVPFTTSISMACDPLDIHSTISVGPCDGTGANDLALTEVFPGNADPTCNPFLYSAFKWCGDLDIHFHRCP